MMDTLRYYQQEMLDKLRRTWKRSRSVMVQMPTGTGKTHLMAEVIAHSQPLPKGEEPRVLVVAHRIELIEQISRTLDQFGIEHGLIVSGMAVDGTKRVQVASIQTLTRRILQRSDMEKTDVSLNTNAYSLNNNGHELNTNFSLIIIDEAHHALAETYRVLWEKWPKAKFLGLTATPCRLNNAPFTDLFDVLLQSWSIQEFIDKGWLSDFEYVSASPDSKELQRVASLKKRGVDGDYQTKELATVMDCQESIAHLYKTYRQFADSKKGIVYAINREHARHIADYYAAQGVRCAVIDSKTPSRERERLVEAYKASPPTPLQGERGAVTPFIGTDANTIQIDVLVNVDIFSEGFDCPEVEFIQLARPTLSLSKYLQQVGRGMRISPGKPHVLILDNVGLYQIFGLPTEERDWHRTFYGLASGKGDTGAGRYVVLDGDAQEKELVNLEMVRIKKGGKRRAGLEIFLKDGRYGVMNGGKVTCQPRFKQIERMKDGSGYFATGIYTALEYGHAVEYASLIDRKGADLNLKLYREVLWMDGYFFSWGKKRNRVESWTAYVYWDPKGNCYYDEDPEFQTVAGVEVAYASEHFHRDALCYKLRYSTGPVSPRFSIGELFYNRFVIVARDYLIVKHDHNHAYRIKGFLPDSIVVQEEGGNGYQQFFTDGKKGQHFNKLPGNVKSSIFQVQMLGMQRP